MAASLLAMVSRLSIDRPKYAEYASTHVRALEVAESARARLLDLADEDARAYGAFNAARKMPRETEAQQQARESASSEAAKQASEVPLEVVRECVQVLIAAEAMVGRSNLNASSDLEVAGRLAAAAARGAAANVMINLPSVGDDQFVGGTTAELAQALDGVDRLVAQISERVAAGTLREAEE